MPLGLFDDLAAPAPEPAHPPAGGGLFDDLAVPAAQTPEQRARALRDAAFAERDRQLAEREAAPPDKGTPLYAGDLADQTAGEIDAAIARHLGLPDPRPRLSLTERALAGLVTSGARAAENIGGDSMFWEAARALGAEGRQMEREIARDNAAPSWLEKVAQAIGGSVPAVAETAAAMRMGRGQVGRALPRVSAANVNRLAAGLGAGGSALLHGDPSEGPAAYLGDAAIEAAGTALGGASGLEAIGAGLKGGLRAVGLDALKEGIEEGATSGAQAAYRLALRDPRALATLEGLADVAEEASVGAAAGSAMAGPMSGGRLAQSAMEERAAVARAFAQALDAQARAAAAPANAQQYTEPGERTTIPTQEPAALPPRRVGPHQIAQARAAELERALLPPAAERPEAAAEIAAAEAERDAALRQQAAQADEEALRRAILGERLDADLPAPRAPEPSPDSALQQPAETPVKESQAEITDPAAAKARHEASLAAAKAINDAHAAEVRALVARRQSGEIGKPQFAQLRDAARARRDAAMAEAMQAVAEGRPIPAQEPADAPAPPLRPTADDTPAAVPPRPDLADPGRAPAAASRAGARPAPAGGSQPGDAAGAIGRATDRQPTPAPSPALPAPPQPAGGPAVAASAPAAAQGRPAVGRQPLSAEDQDTLRRIDERVEAEIAPRFTAGQAVRLRPPNGRVRQGTVVRADERGVEVRWQGAKDTRNLTGRALALLEPAEQPAPQATRAPAAPTFTEQEQADAVAELERIAAEQAARTGRVQGVPELTPQLASLGFRVDRAHSLPPAALRRGQALEAAARARGTTVAELAKQAQERALEARRAEERAEREAIQSEGAAVAPQPGQAAVQQDIPFGPDHLAGRREFTGMRDLPSRASAPSIPVEKTLDGVIAALPDRKRRVAMAEMASAVNDVAIAIEDGRDAFRVARGWLKQWDTASSVGATELVQRAHAAIRHRNQVRGGNAGQAKDDSGVQGQAERIPGTEGMSFTDAPAQRAVPGRLPIAAPTGAARPVKPLREAIDGLADWLGAQTYHVRKGPRGAAGYYDPASGAVAMRRDGDLDTAAHELGHWLDDRFGLVGIGNDTHDGELAAFWPHGSQPPAHLTDDQAQDYRRAEGVAEWLRAWMVNPDLARRAAPVFAARFEGTVPARVRERLADFGADVRAFHHAPAVEAGGANIRALGDTGPTLRERVAAAVRAHREQDQVGSPLTFGLADQTAVRMTDRLAPVAKAIRWAGDQTGQKGNARRTLLLLRNLGGINDKTTAIARDGMVKAEWYDGSKPEGQRIQRAEGVAGGAEWLAGWADTRTKASLDRDLRALDSYMVAQRTIELADRIDQERAEKIASLSAQAVAEHQAAVEALDAIAERMRARAQKQRDRFGGAVDRTGEAQERAESAANRTDADLGKVADKIADGRKAPQDRLSAARDAVARRQDAVSRAIVRIYEGIDRGAAGITEDTERAIAGLRRQARDRFAAKLARIATVSQRLAMRDRARKARLSGQGGGTRADDVQAQRIIADVHADPVLRARLDEGAKRYRAWADGVLAYLRDKGRLSQEGYDAIRAANQQYVSMARIVDEDGPLRPVGGGKLGVARDVVKKIKGSQREIENPLVSLMDATARAVEEADRNEVMRGFVDLLRADRSMKTGPAPDLASVAQRVQGPGDGVVTVFRDGEPEHWKFADPILQGAIKGISEQYRLPALVTALPRLVRAGITHSPDFAVRNRIRDTFQRLIFGQVKPAGALAWLRRLGEQIPGVGAAKDAAALVQKIAGNDAAAAARAERKAVVELAGAAFAGHYVRGREAWHGELRRRVDELRKDKGTILALPGKAWQGYLKAVRGSEFAGRADEFWGVFDQLRAKGVDEQTALQEAAFASRSLIDFNQSGTWIGAAGQMIPFLNASVQGLRSTGQAIARNPAGSFARFVVFGVLPSLAAYGLAAAGGEDELEEYVNLPAWRRDLFWNLKVAPDTWLSIPKPFEAGALATGAERGLEAAHRHHKGQPAGEAIDKAFDGFGGSLAKALMPVDEGALMPTFKPLVEAFVTNRNTFTGRDIVPAYDRDVPMAERQNQHASRIGRLGQALSAETVDARQVDHLVRGVFGSLGGLGLTASDIGRADKPAAAERLARQASGVVKGGAAGDQQDVATFLEGERAAGRAQGKPTQAIKDLIRDYWRAASGRDREAIAASMRDYVEGRDPLMAFDRATSEANRFMAALRDLPPEARAAAAAANRDLIGWATGVQRASRDVADAKKRGMEVERIREIAGRTMAAIRSAHPLAEQQVAEARREVRAQAVAGRRQAGVGQTMK